MTMTRLAPVGATVSILGVLTWLFLAAPRDRGPDDPVGGTGGGAAGQGDSYASAVPCAVPLAWRIDGVDPRFRVSPAQARAAVEQAAALWEQAVGRRLFVFDPNEGLPIRFIYDERQARAEQIRRIEEQFRSEREGVAARRRELDDRRARYSVARAAYEERLRDLRERVSAHNAAVRRWNEAGGAPAEVARELRGTAEALQLGRRELEEAERQLERRRLLLQREEGELRRRVEEHNRRARGLERAFPPASVEAGTYREMVRERRGQVESVWREVRIYRFVDGNHLVRVLAHELGHALGLAHSSVPGSLMSEEGGTGGGLAGPARIHAGDVAALRALCPDL